MNETPKRRWLRFSLKLLLLIMTLVAVYLVGRWNGYQKGRQEALVKVQSASEAMVFWLGAFTDKPQK